LCRGWPFGRAETRNGLWLCIVNDRPPLMNARGRGGAGKTTGSSVTNTGADPYSDHKLKGATTADAEIAE